MNFRQVSLGIAGLIGISSAALLTYAEFHQWQLQHSSQQTRFIQGTYPKPPTDGFYAGLVPGLEGLNWKGKRFDAARASGINIFVQQGQQTTAYPFKTSRGASSIDSQQQVLLIDYNDDANPWWVRMFLDEVVAIGPDHLLGKLIIRLIPGHPIAILFFELQKPKPRGLHREISFSIKKNSRPKPNKVIQ